MDWGLTEKGEGCFASPAFPDPVTSRAAPRRGKKHTITSLAHNDFFYYVSDSHVSSRSYFRLMHVIMNIYPFWDSLVNKIVCFNIKTALLPGLLYLQRCRGSALSCCCLKFNQKAKQRQASKEKTASVSWYQFHIAECGQHYC